MTGSMSAVAILCSVAGVIALTNLAKQVGVSGRWALLTAFMLGVALNLGAYYAGVLYQGLGPFEAASAGALVGLGASGIYDYRRTQPAVEPEFDLQELD